MTARDFATSVDRLLNKVGHWEQSRWWAPAAPTVTPPAAVGSAAGASPPAGRRPAAVGTANPTKADVVYALIQHLADVGADAEHRPRRPVPRLADQVLPDQLRVLVDDLLAADPSEAVFQLAAEETGATNGAL